MAKHDVTNNAKGDRVFNVRDGERVSQVVVPAGETRTLDLVDPEHPAVAAMVESGEIVVKGKAGRPAKETAEPTDLDKMTVDQLRTFIEGRGGAVAADAKKDDLLKQARDLAA